MADGAKLREHHRKIMGKAGVRYRNFHNIRQTFVARLLENNESLACIKDHIHAAVAV